MPVKVPLLAMICLVLCIPMANGALSCGQIQLTIAPCLGYIRSGGPSVPAPCCNGVRSVLNQSKSTLDRQGVCSCLKSTVWSIPGINLPALASIPPKCGVNLPYKIGPSLNCNTYFSNHKLTLSFYA
ncbi:non-specific lipid-transfer protein [Trifolium repens]|nr:non-specific lipid-transfer protein [Trifolium repens]